jgi:hypothetical protein
LTVEVAVCAVVGVDVCCVVLTVLTVVAVMGTANTVMVKFLKSPATGGAAEGGTVSATYSNPITARCRVPGAKLVTVNWTSHDPDVDRGCV